MHKTTYDSMVMTLTAGRNLYGLLAAGLLLVNLMLTGMILTMDKREKTIIVPTGFSKAFYVKGNIVDPVYIEQMTRYLAQLRWTYTETTAQANFREILGFVHPSQFGELDARFSQEALQISRNQLSSAFSPDAFRVYAQEGRAVIRGTHIGYMGTQIVTRGQRFLEIQYEYGGDRFNVTGMKELSGTSFEDLKPYTQASGVLPLGNQKTEETTTTPAVEDTGETS